MANVAPVCIWTTGPDMSRTWFNDRWLSFTGRSLEDEIGFGWVDLVHPDDLDDCLETYKSAFEKRESYEQEYRLRHKDGKYHWMLVRAAPQYATTGEFLGYVGACTDITDRKEVEEELSRKSRENNALFELTDRLHSSEKLSQVFEAALDSIMSALQCDRTSLLLFDENNVMQFVGWRNLSEEYRAGAAGHSPWNKTDRHPVPIVVADSDFTQFEPTLADLIRNEGIRSLGFIPLVNEGQLIGKFMIYFDSPHTFTSSEIGLATTIGRQMAIGISRRRAEVELQENEQRLRLALEAGRMGTWAWTVGTDRVRWSASLEEIYGFAPGEFDGQMTTYLNRIHPEDRELTRETIGKNLKESDDHDVEHRILLPDGTVRWIEGRGRIVRDHWGNPLAMIGIATDITKRKEIELDVRFLADASASLAAATEESAALQKLADLAVPWFADWCSVDLLNDEGLLRRVAVAHVDPLKVQLAHDLHEKYPYDPSEEGGSYDIARSGNSQIVSEITEDLLVASSKNSEILDILRKLGLRSYMGVPLTVRGHVLGVITFIAAESGRRYHENDLRIAEDLAHRAAVAIENSRLLQEMREDERRKDEFLATLAHELRNPLAPMRYALGILEGAGDDPAKRELARTSIERHVGHMVLMVDDLLDISRITRDKLEINLTEVDLIEVIHQCAESARPYIQEHGQELALELSDDGVCVNADTTRLSQILSNLLNNASKFTPQGGKITLKCCTQKDHVLVSVKDNGIGIEPKELPHIFDMFVQGHHSPTPAQGGLGIGLSLVRRLVELHGGQVTAESEGLGHGAEFIVRLPLLAPKDPSSNDGNGAGQCERSRSKKRILVVDDNVDAARMFSVMLEMLGHETDIAYDGEEGVAHAAQFRPDLVLMDIGLPKMNGYEAARAIRASEEGKKMVLVAVTGWGQDEDRRKSKESGFDVHMVKPVSMETVVKLIADHLPV